MKVLNFDYQNQSPEIIDQAMKALKAGQTIIYPTDTLYGLGADATSRKAVENLLRIKNRIVGKPISVIMADLAMVKDYCNVMPVNLAILKKSLPGPYTFILPVKPDTDIVVGTKKTLAVRIPNNVLCQLIAKKFSKPITATSANLSGEEAKSLNEIIAQFQSGQSQPDLLIKTNEKMLGGPSTIVDLTTWPPTLVREGIKPFII